ncbi:MAG: PAS domain S-box protein [Gammaproteobacteria bacterium]
MASTHGSSLPHTHPDPHAPSEGASQAGIELAVLNLDDAGVIHDCSQSCLQIFGYRPDELLGSHVSRLLPQLPGSGLVQEGRIHARLAYLCHCGIAFQARHRDGRHFASELFINRLDSHNVVVLVRAHGESKPVGLSGPLH